MTEIEYRQTDTDSGIHAYNSAESPLDLLLKKKILEPYQYLAGTMFRRDYELFSVSPNRASEIRERVQGGFPKNSLSDNQCDAQQRVKKALNALSPVSRIIIISLCGEGKTITEIAILNGWNKHYTGPRTREALDDLSSHYGLLTFP
jgi:DNA-directed RNA polymerase specialized sigma24 family protein